MSRLPIIDFRTMEKVLLRLGFETVRQKGSHVFYRHSDGRTTSVPHHPGRDLARPLVREILGDIDPTPDQLQRALRKPTYGQEVVTALRRVHLTPLVTARDGDGLRQEDRQCRGEEGWDLSTLKSAGVLSAEWQPPRRSVDDRTAIRPMLLTRPDACWRSQ